MPREAGAAVERIERRIGDIADAGLAQRSGAREERHLMGRALEQVLVRPERILRAVAVMHVEIDHRHALGAMGRAGMLRGNAPS